MGDARIKAEDAALALNPQADKPRPSLLFQSLTKTIAGVIWFSLVLWLSDTISSVVAPRIVHWYEGDVTSSQPYPALALKDIPKYLKSFQDCSIHGIKSGDLSFGANATAIAKDEFIDRRRRLAAALGEEAVDAFVVEPGYTFSYYANVTQPDWEVWEPEERPFLMIVQPYSGRSSWDEPFSSSQTTFLVPAFEEERARLLNMPFDGPISVVTYEEHWDPYQTLRESRFFADFVRPPKLMVDEEMRDFISRGLAEHAFDIVGLGGKIEEVRQRKTAAEIEILRAVNTGTVEAVRAMRRCMAPGLTEADVTIVLDNTLRAAGLDPFFDIVLFDENASNPHGGTDGSKALQNDTMVLVDVGAHLYGYSSDICRSFFPPFSSETGDIGANDSHAEAVKEKLKVWDVVYDAQTASLAALHENATAASVDIAARSVIADAGYGEAFTHRVGHGIGIKAHESPYLNKGNVETLLKAGMTFTSEPGVYLVDKFGVRHEDVLLVRENGLPELLTGRRAQSPWDP